MFDSNFFSSQKILKRTELIKLLSLKITLLWSVIFIFLMNPMAAKAQQQQDNSFHLNVSLGNGQVHIQLEGAHLKPDQKKELQAYLKELEVKILTDEKAADLVMSKDTLKLNLSLSGETSFEEISKSLLTKVYEDNDKLEAQQEREETHFGDTIFSHDNKKVVMGSHLIIEESEFVDEIVVIAGSADIRGHVKKLIVVGGNVRIYPSAEITEELNVIGGYVEKDPGARIRGRSVEVGAPLTQKSWKLVFDHWKDLSLFQWMDNIWARLGLLVAIIFILLFFAVFGYYVAPIYQENIYERISLHPLNSLLWGSLSLIFYIPVFIFLAISLVGIPLLPLQASLYFLFLIYGYINAGRWIGEALLSGRGLQVNLWFRVFLGLLFVELIAFIPILGGVLKGLIIFLGFGAASQVFYKRIFSGGRRLQESRIKKDSSESHLEKESSAGEKIDGAPT